MLTLSISEGGRRGKQIEFDKEVINIGRVEANELVFARENVSKRHSRIICRDGKVVIADLGSTNGTFLNGRLLETPQPLKAGDSIQISDFTIKVLKLPRLTPPPTPKAVPAKAPPQRASPQKAAPTKAPPPLKTKPDVEVKHARPAASAPSVSPLTYGKLLGDIHNRLITHLDLRRLDLDALGDEGLRRRTEQAVGDIVTTMDRQGEIPAGHDLQELIQDVLNEALGLGPLEDYINDDSITEIMVNHANQIYLERGGLLEQSPKSFSSGQAVLGVIERIVAPLGRRIDESSPMVDARLMDGSRVNAIIPPLAVKGPCLTIRKFMKEALTIEDLMRFNSITPQMAEFLEVCVKARRNLVISGGTGSGKTTTLNMVSSFIPEEERIVTVEDAAELKLHQEHWVSLESRPPNIEGKGAIVIRDLVRNCLRMRPDRIIVGECRGGEALDMLQAMNTGHDGSLTTIHANSPRDALSRIETMVMMAGMDLPVRAIREQIASAINIICHQSRFPDGSRKLTHIAEITGMEVDIITMQDIFLFQQEGFDDQGRVRGRYKPTGFIPQFYDEMQRRGLPVKMELFRED